MRPGLENDANDMESYKKIIYLFVPLGQIVAVLNYLIPEEL